MTAAPARAYDGDTSTILMTTSAAGYSAPRRSAVKTQSPRHDPLFRLWFAADTSQLAARVLTSVALPLLAIAVTTSSSAASLVVAASAAGTSVALLPGGMMADRLKRDRLIGTLACLTAVAYCLIAGFESLRSSVSLVWLLGFVFCAAVFQSMATPAFSATLKSLVPADRFAAAASLSEGRSAALGLAIPAVGGVLYTLGSWVPFLVAALAALLAAYFYRRLPRRSTTVAAKAPAEHQGFWSGISFVIRTRTLCALVFTVTVVNFAASAVMIATIFHLRSQGVSAAVVGLSTSALAVGSMCGAVVAAVVVPRVRGGVLIGLCLVWLTAMILPIGIVASNAWVVIGLMALAILSAPVLNAVIGGYLVAKVPSDLQGRVDSAVSFLGSVTTPLAPLVAGFALDIAGYPGAVAFCAVLVLGAGIPALTCRGVRSIPRPEAWGSLN